MRYYPVLETRRLRLRSTGVEDADFILKLLNMPKWAKYIGDRNVHNREEAIQYIKTKMLPQYHRLGFGNYTVFSRTSGEAMGTCGLYDRPGLEGLDIGFAFLPEFEGFGYAYEAAKCLVDKAFDEIGISVIQAITTPDNIASQRLLKKLNFRNMGSVRLPEDEEELLLFRIQTGATDQ